MGPIGIQEMIAIFILALVLFGPKKLPELGRLLGKGLSEFRRAKNELKNTFETHMHELEREARLQDQGSSKTPDYSPSRYTYPYEEYRNPYDSTEASTPSYETTVAPEAPQQPAALPEAFPADTVPRSNGVQPLENVTASEEQKPV
ncbi:MAG: twin-arginine translocase TatA/TatE family subunit [Acidobacteriaceae bacterium]|nr:twin-arginine translocase TatA/TatE family subunit [Acidobacteriaceae bacterium]